MGQDFRSGNYKEPEAEIAKYTAAMEHDPHPDREAIERMRAIRRVIGMVTSALILAAALWLALART